MYRQLEADEVYCKQLIGHGEQCTAAVQRAEISANWLCTAQAMSIINDSSCQSQFKLHPFKITKKETVPQTTSTHQGCPEQYIVSKICFLGVVIDKLIPSCCTKREKLFIKACFENSTSLAPLLLVLLVKIPD